MTAPLNARTTPRFKWRRSSTIATAVLAAIIAASALGNLAPRAALADADATFTTAANPGGGTIVTGTLGGSSLPEGTAILMRHVHALFGTRPSIVQVAQNQSDHTLALLFTVTRGGAPFTGIGIITAVPGAQTSGAALYDMAARFGTTVGPMVRRLGMMTVASGGSRAPVKMAPAEPLVAHPFSDGTGSIGIPEDWHVGVAAGGSALVANASGSQVSYNMHFGAVDPSSPRAQMFLRMQSQSAPTIVLPFTNDAARAWVAFYSELAKQHGLTPTVHVTGSTQSGGTTLITGTLGEEPKTLTFFAHPFVLPPDPNGLWHLSDSHVFFKTSELGPQGATAMAILSSVRINFQEVAAQQDAVRQMFQKSFEAEIARDRAQDAVRRQGTDEALASDRAAQEGMHRQAVAMENYSLDRAVVVNARTGIHSTVDSDFADDLVSANSNYQKVPARDLLRGIDY